MDAVPAALLDADGLVGNADRGGARAITVISLERWDELMRDVGASLDSGARRANFVVAGLDFEGTRGRVLSIGGCELLVRGETRPCERMEAAAGGLQRAMQRRWGGGVYASVTTGGHVAVGDPVRWK